MDHHKHIALGFDDKEVYSFYYMMYTVKLNVFSYTELFCKEKCYVLMDIANMSRVLQLQELKPNNILNRTFRVVL